MGSLQPNSGTSRISNQQRRIDYFIIYLLFCVYKLCFFMRSPYDTPTKKMKFTALLLVGAAALANAGPLASRDTCATICDIDQTKFKYEPGKTYAYDYEGETLTTIVGASEEISGLHVRTTARIRLITPCEFELELRGTELSHLAPTDATTKTA